MKTLIHIVPNYPPAKGGVADFCNEIVDKIPNVQHVVISFQQNKIITPNNPHVTFKTYPKFNLGAYLNQIINNLENKETVNVMLHYVSYGYHPFGLPTFLLHGLSSIKTKLNIITFFHEIYSLGTKRPWQSSFWYQPLQKKLIKKLALMSNTIYTNNLLYKEHLIQLGIQKEIVYQPVFSNVGELPQPLNISSRKNQLVIFGGNNLKRNLENNIEPVTQLIQQLNIASIINIGAPLLLKSIGGVELIDEGYLHKKEVSIKMSQAKYGVLCYNNMPIEKSGVFAAYAAHGLIPILLNTKITDKQLKKILLQPLSTIHPNEIHDWYLTQANKTNFCHQLNQQLI
ncbi:MAG: hypothetical protein RQ875_08110 [Vicingaceae bacterium]|nr:hypothetical protein [Vicingaceae bacterium]